jgi:uncharacterized protein
MRRALALALVLLVAAACSSTATDPGTQPASLVVTTETGKIHLNVEVADSPEERAMGLMGRERLAPYDGMVFSWPEPTSATFWMKNTLIPLSIAFWDERGRIVGILDMEPCEAEPCPHFSIGGLSIGALEVEQGLFDERGITVGDRVQLAGATS